MLNEWELASAYDEKLEAERRIKEQEREMIRVQLELMRWKADLERRVPYSPPLTFEQKIDKVIELLETYGPKLAALADVLGAMHLDEEKS